MTDNTIEFPISQKIRLVKVQTTNLDTLVKEEASKTVIELGQGANDTERTETHLVDAVKKKSKIPYKKPVKEDNYHITGYVPELDFQVYNINNFQQNILYDLTDEDFKSVQRDDQLTLDLLQFTYTALDLMFPFKYKSLAFTQQQTLNEIYEALRIVFKNPEFYGILLPAPPFPEFDIFEKVYKRFAERRRQYKNEPLIPVLREKISKNKMTYFQPYCEEVRKQPKTNQQLRQINLLYQQFAEFAVVREQLNLWYYYQQYRDQLEHYGFAPFENIVDVPDVPMPFRQPIAAQVLQDLAERSRESKADTGITQGQTTTQTQQKDKQKGSQFGQFVQICMADEASDSS